MRVIKYFHTVNLPFLFPSNHKILKLKGNSIFWEEAKNLNKGDVCLSPVDNVFSNNYSIDIRHISNNDNRCRKRKIYQVIKKIVKNWKSI